MYEPPPGYEDMLSDAEDALERPQRFRPLTVEGVGTVLARRPLPNSTAALGMSMNSKIDGTRRADYQTLFVRNHLHDGEFDRILEQMIMGDMPVDTVGRVAKAICTWGTPRPT